MALLDNNEKQTANKSDKVVLGIIVVLILVLVSIIGLMVFILNTEETEIKQSIVFDGVQNDTLLNNVIVQNQIKYIPIKEIAKAAGYDAYNGDYIYVSEDVKKCHVIIKNEQVVQFEANSNKASKIKFDENIAYAKLTLNQPIIAQNNELYISIEDVQNALYIYTENIYTNNMQMYSLDNLYNLYNNYTVSLGYKGITNSFANKIAILNDILVFKNNKDKFGAINTAAEIIIEPKYDDIQYVQETKDFIVTYNGLKGIISNKQTKLNVSYDEIEYINYANLYAVTSNKKIGFFDANGNKIIDFQYDDIGSKTQVKNAKSVQYVTTKGLLVVKSNGKYGLINLEGTPIVGFELEDVYSSIYNGKLEYYVVVNGNTLNLNTIVQ